MKTFQTPLLESNDYSLIIKSLKEKPSGEGICISGCSGSGQVHFMSGITDRYQYGVIITYSDRRAREIYEDYLLYDKNVVYYPAKDFIFFNADIHGNLTLTERLSAIKKIIEGEHCVIITTIDGLMDKIVPLDVIRDNILHFTNTDTINLTEVRKKLTSMSYEKVSQVEVSGQYAIRGEILDIFPVGEDTPIRIDLWDDEIDSIKYFDVESQRSIENVAEVTIYPATEYILDEEQILSGIKSIKKQMEETCGVFRKAMKTEEAHRLKTIINEFCEQLSLGNYHIAIDSYIRFFYDEMSSLMHYLEKEDVIYLIDEPAKMQERSTVVESEFRESMVHRIEKGYMLSEQADVMNTYEQILSEISKHHFVVFTMLIQKIKDIKMKDHYNVEMKNIVSYNSSFELLIKDLKRYKKNGYKVLLLSHSTIRAQRMVGNLRDYGIEAFFSDNFNRPIQSKEIMVSYGNIHQGFEYPLFKFVVITQSDIFGKEKSKKRKQKKQYTGKKIQDFSQLNIGDYVVHENHGLGIYRGIEKIEVDAVVKDYIKIEYADNSNLYILATQLDLIQKYAGADAKAPKINKLGSKEWTNTKTRVKTAVKNIAKDLVEIYAERQNKKGYEFGKDTVWQREFEDLFPYEETYDQLRAIEDTKRDMESDKIMDRLICGDVGYGKTEIAIRAAFKAVQDGKQVAVLVPTTILAQQHYNTFTQRMKEYPIRIDMMSRFRTAKGVADTKAGLKTGEVDIVIGTHKLLGKDIAYKDLGLLIVDEEQRFGVTHKEKIKQMKKDVDVLTLTATPIPRTLHMSLVGIRDMSVLEEPPVDRIPIQTYVMEYDDEMVREAINRELIRGGQVYYVHNRVNDIDEVTNRISKLVPDANVVFAHGQMSERKLEQIMYDFIEGEIEVLVSTTIVETGLDISNVNTIIIDDADRFGLSQLHQLRGRVGRSNRTSYAFLMYRRDKVLREVAEKRLQAIREFTEVGSGFKIAMRDLEIRGAGNVLGAEQHGHMAAVGYDLYCKLLNEAVAAMKGETIYDDFETKIDLNIDAYIPSSYIKNEMQKINVYKQVASIENEDDYSDMQDELIDRFGDMPQKVVNLLSVALIKSLAHKAWITEISESGKNIKIIMYHNAELNGLKIPALIEKYRGKLKFVPGTNPYFLYMAEKKIVSIEEYKRILLEIIEGIKE